MPPILPALASPRRDTNIGALHVESDGARWIFLNGTSMASPHTAGVAALLKQRHPNWGPGALKAAVLRTATALSCPPEWRPETAEDTRECSGGTTNSFFGHGLVNAADAARE